MLFAVNPQDVIRGESLLIRTKFRGVFNSSFLGGALFTSLVIEPLNSASKTARVDWVNSVDIKCKLEHHRVKILAG